MSISVPPFRGFANVLSGFGSSALHETRVIILFHFLYTSMRMRHERFVLSIAVLVAVVGTEKILCKFPSRPSDLPHASSVVLLPSLSRRKESHSI